MTGQFGSHLKKGFQANRHTYRSRLHRIDRGSRLLHRTSSSGECTSHCRSGIPGKSSGEPEERSAPPYRSSGATRPSRRRSRRRRRRPTEVEGKRCYCTEKKRRCTSPPDKRPRRCRRCSRLPRRTQRSWTHTGRLRSGIPCPCSFWVLRGAEAV